MMLSPNDAVSLAKRVVARHIDGVWLEWEDYPELTEQAFHLLSVAVNDIAKELERRSDRYDEENDVDSGHLLERADP